VNAGSMASEMITTLGNIKPGAFAEIAKAEPDIPSRQKMCAAIVSNAVH